MYILIVGQQNREVKLIILKFDWESPEKTVKKKVLDKWVMKCYYIQALSECGLNIAE